MQLVAEDEKNGTKCDDCRRDDQRAAMQLVAEDEKNASLISTAVKLEYVPQCSSSRRTRRTPSNGP